MSHLRPLRLWRRLCAARMPLAAPSISFASSAALFGRKLRRRDGKNGRGAAGPSSVALDALVPVVGLLVGAQRGVLQREGHKERREDASRDLNV